VFMDRGRVVEAGPPREVVFGSSSPRAREFFAGFTRYGGGATGTGGVTDSGGMTATGAGADADAR
jgi:hypothetical protein